MTSDSSVTPGDTSGSASSSAPSTSDKSVPTADPVAVPVLIESLDTPEAIAAEVSDQLEAFLAE